MTLVPVWQQDRPDPVTPTPVEGHHDVVVVGAGLTGLTSALLLARAGRSVLVVEARHVGAGTTGRSTAKVSVLQGTRLSDLSRRHSREVVGHYVAAHREGLEWVRRFCETHAVPAQSRSAWTYATSARGARSVREEHEAAAAAGLPVRWDAEAPLPFPTTAGVELADQLQVDPQQLLEALAAEAVRHGTRIAEGARVRRVSGSDPVTVETETGRVTAGAVVLATNLPMLDRGAHFARWQPARSYSVAFRADRLDLGGMFLSADAPHRSLRDAPLGEGQLLLVGGEGHVTGRDGATGRRLENLRDWTGTYFPGLTETHAWSAQDYVPAHGLPVAGRVLPGADHLLMAGGYAKWGMTGGVAAALALSSRLLGGHTEWAAAMEAWSRRELSGVARAALFNAEVGLELSRGWLAPLWPHRLTPAEGQGVVRWDGARTPTAHCVLEGVEHRVSAVCSHLGGVLRWNEAEASWDCPLHGSRFAPDGEVLEGPATRPLRRR